MLRRPKHFKSANVLSRILFPSDSPIGITTLSSSQKLVIGRWGRPYNRKVPMVPFAPYIVRQLIELEPAAKRVLRHSGGATQVAILGGEQAS